MPKRFKMTKLPKSEQQVARPPWVPTWPRTNDLRAWMLAMVAVAEQIEDSGDRESNAHFVVGEVARLGHVDEALAILERFIGSFESDHFQRSRLVEFGASICFDAGRQDNMEIYLKRVLDLEPLFKRKCDRGCQAASVRQFKAFRGLLDPADAEDDEKRLDAAFTRKRRLADLAIAAGNAEMAIEHLCAAELMISGMPDWRQHRATSDLLVRFFRAGDCVALKRLLEKDDIADERNRVLPHTLLEIGERDRANRRFEVQVREGLEKLKTERLNVHFPAMKIGRAIEGLVDSGERERARLCLQTALEESRSWLMAEPGAFSAAVFISLAKAAAKADGALAAKELLGRASKHAQSERRSNWRGGAIDEIFDILVNIGEEQVALEEARKVRSHRGRRMLLAQIMARQKDWDALHSVLDQASSASEAAELIWKIKFVWFPAK